VTSDRLESLNVSVSVCLSVSLSQLCCLCVAGWQVGVSERERSSA